MSDGIVPEMNKMKEKAAILFAGLMVVLAMLAVGLLATEDAKKQNLASYKEGQAAGYYGHPPDACPYSPRTTAHERWKTGWMHGAEARKAKEPK